MPDTDTATAVTPTPDGGGFLRLLKTLFASLILIAIGVLATLALQGELSLPFLSSAAPTASAPAKAPPAEPIFVPLEPFTVTLRDQNASVALYVGITLKVADEASRTLLRTYMPEVRDRVLRTLARQPTADIQAADGSALLATQIVTALNQAFDTETAPPQVTQVLFTAYVVQ